MVEEEVAAGDSIVHIVIDDYEDDKGYYWSKNKRIHICNTITTVLFFFFSTRPGLLHIVLLKVCFRVCVRTCSLRIFKYGMDHNKKIITIVLKYI